MSKPINFSCYDIYSKVYRHNMLNPYTTPGVYMISELKFQDRQLLNSWVLSTTYNHSREMHVKTVAEALFPIPRFQSLPTFLSLKEWVSICNACSWKHKLRNSHWQWKLVVCFRERWNLYKQNTHMKKISMFIKAMPIPYSELNEEDAYSQTIMIARIRHKGRKSS